MTQVGVDHYTVIPPESALMRTAEWPVFPYNDVQRNPNPQTYQYLFDLPADVAGPTRAIAFRRTNFRSQQPGTMPSFRIGVTLSMGHSASAPSLLSFAQSANRGTDFRQVTARRLVNFPAVPARLDNQYDFTHRIPLDQPFRFAAGSTGLLEMRIDYSTLDYFTSIPTDLFFDARFSCDLPPSIRGVADFVGAACGPSGAGYPDNEIWWSSLAAAGNANRLVMGMMNGSINVPPWARLGPTIFFGGASDTTWGPHVLPLALDTLGSPGCSLYTSVDWVFPSLTDWLTVPFSSADITVPNDPRLHGATFFVQAIRLAHGYNPLGLYTSNAYRFRIIPFLRTTMAHTYWGDQGFFGSSYVDGFAFGGPVILLDAR